VLRAPHGVDRWAKEDVLVRSTGFLMIAAAIGLGACAVGSDADGVFVSVEQDAGVLPTSAGPSPAGSDDAGTPNTDPSDAGPAPTGDATAAPEDASSPDDPADASRVSVDAGSSAACVLEMSTGDPPCDSCLAANCCSADDACGGSSDCLAVTECMDDCEMGSLDAGATDAGSAAGINSCLSACQTQNPIGSDLLNALDSCLENACGGQCGP
jgi:hypothetical protein